MILNQVSTKSKCTVNVLIVCTGKHLFLKEKCQSLLREVTNFAKRGNLREAIN